MDENKNYETEEIEETAAAEEAVEETAATEESAPVEAVEEIVPAAEDAAVVKKSSKVGAIVAALVAVVVIAAAVITSQMEFNKYNKMGYVDISGQTIGDIVEAQGITLEEFLEMYSLPEDMPASTTESAAYYNIPTGKVAEMYGMDFDTLKAALQLDDSVTAEMTWGEAEGMVTLAAYMGEENVDAFKEQYGLGDEITGETQWKDIRPIVDQMQKEAREAEEKQAEEAAKAASEAEAGADTEVETDVEADAETQDDAADAGTENEVE